MTTQITEQHNEAVALQHRSTFQKDDRWHGSYNALLL